MAGLSEALLRGTDNHDLAGRCLAHYAAATPDKAFLAGLETGARITWAEARAFADRFAVWLAGRGIGAGDRVVVLSDNAVEALLLFVALMRRGASICPIDYASAGAEAATLIRRLGPRLVLWHASLDCGGLAAEAPGEWLPFGDYDASAPGWGVLPELAAVDGAAAEYVGRPDSESIVCFTSGTASAPKGVIHRYDNYPLVAKSANIRWGITADDRFLEYRSFAWQSTHTLSLTPALVAGAGVGFARRFSRSRFFDWIRAWRPTVVIGIPAVVNVLVTDPVAVAPADVASIRFMTCSTAPLHQEQLEAFERRYGIRVVQHYGMSEGGMLAGNPPEARRLGTVGPACPLQTLRVLDAEGNELPAGETGEIAIGGPQICYGYLLEDGTVERLRGAPLRTGDLGHLDGDGYLRITGRTKDLINRGGVKIAPLEVDKALMAIDGIADAATIGAPDPVYGEEVVSYVVAKDGRRLDTEAVLAHCARTLAAYKRPRRVELIEAIPRNDRGKIDRGALVERWKRENAPATRA